MALDKTLLLFGPGKHFGLQLARRFAREDFHVAFLSRSHSDAERLVSLLEKEGFASTFIPADVTNASDLKDIVFNAAQKLPPVRAVIFNAKASKQGNGLNVPPETLMEILGTNVGGALATIQACVPVMEQGSTIVLTGGGYKDVPNPERLALSVSKAALHNLFLSMLEPLGSAGIQLKSLVIDGAVGGHGSLSPEEVANAFWGLYQQDSTDAVRIS